jgi:acyl dehydratase
MSRPTVDDVARTFGAGPLVSEWVEVRQEEMDGFAAVTGDHDWMHTDPERARAEGFGGTIAFGFWTLSLLTRFLRDSVGSEYPPGARFGFNYGLDRVRFLAPVPVGCRIRNRLTVTQVREKDPGRFLVSLHNEVEVEGAGSAVMVADWLVLFVYPEGS